MNLAFRDIRQRCGTRLARVPMTFRLAMGCIGLTLSLGAAAGELGDLLHGVLQHPQVRAAASEAGAARAQEQAATGRYYGAASLSAGWHRYEDKRVVGVYTPGTPGAPLISEEIGQVGLSYALPVDLFGVIAANRERAQKDVAVAELLTRQQTLLKLHQASSAYLTLQSLLRQRDALAATSQRVVATYRRVREEVTRGRAAGVDARYAESELARLEADQAVLEGALVQAQNDLAEASGVENFLPASADIAVPVWESTGDSILPAQIALARRESARAQAEEARRALLPSLSLDASLFRNLGTSDSRDTWAVGAVISMPLGATAYRKADAQQLTARARAEQAEAARRDGERQLASLRAAYDAAQADAAAMEREVAYREQVVQVQQEMARLGSQTLENLFRHERDLLDACYRLAQSRARTAVAWSSTQVLLGTLAENYIARWEDQ